MEAPDDAVAAIPAPTPAIEPEIHEYGILTNANVTY